MWSIWQTLNVLLDYWYINPSNLIYWQQDVVSQHFLLPWFWIPASWGSPSPSLHLISSLNLSCSCLWFLLCLADRLKALLVPVTYGQLSAQFYFGGQREWFSLSLCFFSLKILFVRLFFSVFNIGLYICPPALLLLHSPAWITCRASVSVSWVSPTHVKSLRCCGLPL